MLSRAVQDKAFWVVFGASVLGYIHQSAWVVFWLGLLLTVWSKVSDEEWFRRFREAGELGILAQYWLTALARNIGLVGLSYLLGSMIRELQ